MLKNERLKKIRVEKKNKAYLHDFQKQNSSLFNSVFRFFSSDIEELLTHLLFSREVEKRIKLFFI